MAFLLQQLLGIILWLSSLDQIENKSAMAPTGWPLWLISKLVS